MIVMYCDILSEFENIAYCWLISLLTKNGVILTSKYFHKYRVLDLISWHYSEIIRIDILACFIHVHVKRVVFTFMTLFVSKIFFISIFDVNIL